MTREHRIVTALGPTPVPVARTLGLCLDTEVTGAPFYVMEFVTGHVVRDAPMAESVLDEAGRRRASESLIDVLAQIHAVDVDGVGLGDLGRGPVKEPVVECLQANADAGFGHKIICPSSVR